MYNPPLPVHNQPPPVDNSRHAQKGGLICLQTAPLVDHTDLMRDLDEWISGLRDYRAKLAGELARVDRALAALADDKPNASSGNTSATQTNRSAGETSPVSASKTYETLRAIMERHAGQTYTAEEAHEALLAEGWETDASDPINALRTALARMAKRGEISRVGRGSYAYATPINSPPYPSTPEEWSSEFDSNTSSGGGGGSIDF